MTLTAKGRKDKGSRAEREVAAILNQLLGVDARRTLAGHPEDIGDLHGLLDTVIEVKNFSDIGRAVREGLDELVKEQANAGATYAACFVRRPGGRYFVCLTPEQWAALWREATA
jgi:hypothetical protein